MADIAIVGGGPVGLWLGINVKKHNPDIDVQVYERYTQYQRSHVLRLRHLATMLYASHDGTARENQFIKEVTGRSLKEVFVRAAGYVFIRTNDLEAALKSYAQDLGVGLHHRKIEGPDDIMALHPECRQFVAADGAHSVIRNALMGEDAIRDYPLQYVTEVKYQAQGAAGRLDFLGDQYKANKLVDHMIFEYVGKEKEGVTPVTLRAFLDRATYDAVPQATFKEPLFLSDSRMPPALVKSIETYMNVRKARAHEAAIDESVKVTKLTLSMYAAKRFAQMQDDRAWFLAGDAAMGVPYFRSLNAGFFVGSQLAYILSRDLSLKNKVRAYNTCRPADIAWEFITARGKNIALDAYNGFRQISAEVPWEIATYDAQTVKDMKTPRQRPPELGI